MTGLKGVRSLDVVREEVRAERGAQLQRFDLALWTVWPRRYWSTNLRSLRDKYLAAEPQFTLLQVVDTQIDMAERMAEILHRKGTHLKRAMVALAAAVLLIGIGLGIH